MKLSLCIISKPVDEEAVLLDRCLNSVADYVDEICLTLTGQNKEIERVVGKYKAKISYIKWENDFAKARNFNFSQAEGKYVFWCDVDDLIRGAENLPTIIKKMEEDDIDAGICDYLYDFDKNGNCTVKHRKTRIVKNDGCVEWAGIIHEDFAEIRKINAYYIKGIQVLHLTSLTRIEKAKQRNLEISLEALKKESQDPRSYWLVANAYLSLGDWENTISHFQAFIPRSSSEIEVFTAYHRMAIAYMSLEKYEEAINCALKEITMKPWFPDGYLMLGEIYLKTGNPRKAKEFLIQGLTKEIPEDEYIVWNPRDYDFNPLRLLTQCYMELAKPKEAKQCLEKCMEIYPNNEQIKKLIERINKIIEDNEKVNVIFEKAQKLKDKNEIKKLLDIMPTELKSHPKLCFLRNVNFVKEESSGKDLVIYCYQTPEDFNPEVVMKQGRGGSEEAVVHASKRLKDLGWNVTVYASCGHKEQNFDGVTWKPFWEFNIRDKQDVLIVWRNPLLFDFEEVNATKRYVWLHDVLSEKEFTPKRLDRITGIFALSKAQRNLFPKIPDEKFIITGNGISVEDIKKVKEERNLYRLIYTSSADRGLECLLKLFPIIKKEIPQAELHVFYGWHVWDAMYENDPAMKNKKEQIIELLDQPGVYEHGRVSQEQILKEYAKSSIWAYPTEFFEISCISALKSQALQCLPITTEVGALKETVQYGIKLPFQDIYTNKKAQQIFVETIIYYLKNPKKRELIMKKAPQWIKENYDWDLIINNWNNEFRK